MTQSCPHDDVWVVIPVFNEGQVLESVVDGNPVQGRPDDGLEDDAGGWIGHFGPGRTLRRAC